MTVSAAPLSPRCRASTGCSAWCTYVHQSLGEHSAHRSSASLKHVCVPNMHTLLALPLIDAPPLLYRSYCTLARTYPSPDRRSPVYIQYISIVGLPDVCIRSLRWAALNTHSARRVLHNDIRGPAFLAQIRAACVRRLAVCTLSAIFLHDGTSSADAAIHMTRPRARVKFLAFKNHLYPVHASDNTLNSGGCRARVRHRGSGYADCGCLFDRPQIRVPYSFNIPFSSTQNLT